jgi:hypothetical protein
MPLGGFFAKKHEVRVGQVKFHVRSHAEVTHARIGDRKRMNTAANHRRIGS